MLNAAGYCNACGLQVIPYDVFEQETSREG